MDLRQLRQFVAVAEAGSFRRAAEQLCMAQPPLSVAMRKLEADIGVPLLDRSARGVRLTAAGQATLESARRCLRAADEVVSAARAAASGEAGLLRIGFIGSVTHGLLPQLIRAFHLRFPGVKLELCELANQEVLASVANDTLDLGFVRVPTARPPGVDFQLVQRDVFVVALPAQHPLTQRKRLVLQDLADQPFIGYTPSRVGGLHAAVTQLLMQAGVSPPITQEAVQVQTVIGLVESGLGLALVPSVHAPHASRRVAFRPLADLPKNFMIGIALAHRNAAESIVAQRFRALVTDSTAEQPTTGP